MFTTATVTNVKSRYMQPTGDYSYIYCDMPYPMPVGSEGLKKMIKCGVCKKCKSMRRAQWTGRLMAEASPTKHVTFATLTYAPEHEQQSFDYTHIQLYLKRLRRCPNMPKLRFFSVGEKGDKFGRIHWHLILFGHQPYGRERLQVREWPYGLVQYAPASPKTMSYVASYTLKKKRKQTTYISHMSRRPGIGTQTMQELARQMAASNTTWPKQRIMATFGPSKYPIDLHTLRKMQEAFTKAGGIVPPYQTPYILDDMAASLFDIWRNEEKEIAFYREQVFAENNLPR